MLVDKSRFLPFSDAVKISRLLHIQNCKEWQRYTKSPLYDNRIPVAPDDYYSEWTNWYDFLGKSRELRKYKVNDDYFKKWSHDMAYILGFWFADGYIKKVKNKGSCVFSIKQHIKDRYLMEQILQEMGSNYPIREDGNSCYFEVNSKIIFHDLLKLGGKERKSLDVEFPLVPDAYLPDFVRGLWDGDGTISEGRRLKSGGFCGYKASICGGSKQFLSQLKEILEKNIVGIHITEFEHRVKIGTVMFGDRTLKKNSVIYNLNLSPNNLRMLRGFMYSTPSKLKMIRKYEKFVDAGEDHPTPGSIKYMRFEEAKQLIKNKNFRSMHDYSMWLKCSNCNVILPASPDVVYEEWKGWPDFLGHYRASYNELSALAIQNKISGRRQYYSWIKKIRGNTRGKYPRHPQLVYKEWTNWYDFLGRNVNKIV